MAQRGSQLSNRTVMVWLGIFVVAALALRVGGNIDASYDEETGRYLYSGNDPYYHDRTVNHIVETGDSLLWDPAINFPDGAPNPNPPLFDWTAALDAKILTLFGVEQEAAVGLSLNLGVAFWGALTVIPVFLIGAELFSRRAGLWAAFFMAVSAPHIQRGVFGFADHDATTMFFIVLAMAFAIKGVRSLDDREYVPDWRNSTALLTGLKASFQHNKQAMLWSALAGTALSATALTWKGYPYVLAVLAVAVGLHLLSDHLKNKDSTAVWAFYMLPLIMVTIIPMVYYGAFPTFQDTTIWAGIYVLVGVAIVGAILVPTRDLPSILVFPALILAGALGLVLMLYVFPNIGETVFTGLGYFKQTKLYTTIAEAQRSELGRVAASFGFFSFVIAFGGLWHTFKKAWKGDGAHLLMLAWGLVALFMAFAASRFVMNAAPVFAIFAGAMMPTFTNYLKLDEVRKRFRQQHGQNQFKAAMKSLNGRAISGGLLVFAFFILPNVWIGADAAMPREYELEHGLADDDPETVERFGAFGIDFSIKTNGWLHAFNDLAKLDTGMPIEDKPGFIAWWDYGHWATDIGKHPTVADPFQNHYNVAGRFLAAESEQAGVAWLTILLINADYNTDDRKAYSPAVEAALRDVDPALLEIGPHRGYDDEISMLRAVIDMSGEEVFDLYNAVSDAAGKTVGYFAVDQRMYPFDAEQSPGIFYAPSYLANKNPDDFIQYRYTGSGLTLTVQQYGVDSEGNSYRLPVSKITAANGAEYEVFPGANGAAALPKGQTPTQANPGTSVSFGLQPTQRFYDSMYARAFGHSQNGFVPGEGLSHWRVISQATNQAVELLEYFRGASVSGTVMDDGGQPMSDVTVTFVDSFGASHAKATTAADGSFTVIAPFSIDTDGDGMLDDLELQVRGPQGAKLANSTAYQFTREQAMTGFQQTGASLTVERSDLSGRIYQDVNANGAYDTNDTVVAGALVTFAGNTMSTDANGNYQFMDVQPGSYPFIVSAAGYNNVTTTHALGGGQDATKDQALTPTPSQVTFTLADGSETFSAIPFTVTGPNSFSRQLTTGVNGTAALSLAPGTYNIDLSYQETVDGVVTNYTANWTGAVPFGGDDRAFSIFVTKSMA